MPEYKFRAMLKDGSKISGKMLANNKHTIIAKLKESKAQPITISKIRVSKATKEEREKKAKIKKANFSSLFVNKNISKKNVVKNKTGFKFNPFNKVKVKDIVAFSNNLYILKKANFNNIQALNVLYDGTENPKLKDTIEDLILGVQEGEKLSDIMDNYPDVFSNMYVSFVRLGEKTGSLDKSLFYARNYLEKTNALNKSIKKVMIPRVLQFAGLTLMIIVGVILGVPMMQNIYDMFESDAAIPAATQVAFEMSQWLMSYWYIPVGIIAATITLFILYINTLRGRYNFDRFLVKVPVIGNLIRSIIISRFFQAMLMNLKNGMRIQESLETSKEVTNNYYFLSVIEIARANSLAGKSWVEPFENNGLFQPMTLQMINTGMKTDLAEMMSKVTEYLDLEIQESVDRFTKWLPEVSYIFIGIMMVIFMIVIMVPLINIYMGSFLL